MITLAETLYNKRLLQLSEPQLFSLTNVDRMLAGQ